MISKTFRQRNYHKNICLLIRTSTDSKTDSPAPAGQRSAKYSRIRKNVQNLSKSADRLKWVIDLIFSANGHKIVPK